MLIHGRIIEETIDKVFWISGTEVASFDELPSTYRANEENNEGEQYEYYKIKENRIKHVNNNGQPASPNRWWLRSPSATNTGSPYYYYYFIYISSSGLIDKDYNVDNGNAPAFCL